jgi:ABC-2 type transport system ATP-binding protein
VLRVETAGATLRVFAERAGETLSPLLRAAAEAGAEVRNIHLAPPSLETLFVSLTGRKLD